MTSLPPDRQRLVETWLRYQAEKRDEDLWACGEVDEIVWSDPHAGWTLILALVDQAPDELLGMVGVGPIEDLIGHHPREVIDKVVKQARADDRFLDALCASWYTAGQLPPYVERQLLEVSHGTIRIMGLSV
jgi:hypothetical protein